MNATKSPIITVQNLNKIYSSGFQALRNVNLEIRRGEIFALLGPNGAGKTTLINIICGLVNASSGSVTVDELDIVKDARSVRARIGLVPQELTGDVFEKVRNTVALSRGLFGFAPSQPFLEKILRALSLWDKRDNTIRTLSGGMKRRVMIAKALAHEPTILFLDEPSAGVDTALRRDMWKMVRELRTNGVTIILTTHYIEEAEEMADRIGIINRGEITMVEEKEVLMQKLGKKKLRVTLTTPLAALPESLVSDQAVLSADGKTLQYTYDQRLDKAPSVSDWLKKLAVAQIEFSDLQTEQTSLEDIFMTLVASGGTAL